MIMILNWNSLNYKLISILSKMKRGDGVFLSWQNISSLLLLGYMTPKEHRLNYLRKLSKNVDNPKGLV